MNNDPQSRRLKVKLIVRDEKDDPSILDIVRVALEDGLRTPTIDTTTSAQEPVSEQPERHSPVDENLETAAREAIEEGLAKVVERFQTEGKEPAFTPAKLAEQLTKVWGVVQKVKASGVQLRVVPNEPLLRAETP